MEKFIITSLLCLLLKVLLFVVIVIGDGCSNEANCIPLAECKVLQTGIQRGQREFLSLSSFLRCGVNSTNGDLKVCCPPEFLNSLPEKTVQIDDATVVTPAVNLLPNVSVCGIQYTDRMYGGSRTGLDEHTWVALLRYDKPRGSGYYCGGVLISARYVLTAAHCIIGEDLPTNWTVSQVRLGEWNISSDPDCNMAECAPPVIDVDVEETISHSEYKPRDGHQQNDIALIRLAKEVPFNDFVKPICLPTGPELRDTTFQGQTVEIVGWSKKKMRTTSDVKLKARISLVEQSLCRDIYRRAAREITVTQLCAKGSEGEDACRGDPGGPLIAQIPPLSNWIVIGVESYGPSPCGVRGWPAVYTRITSYMEWIINNIRP